MSDDLLILRAQFPAYKIWREKTRGRVRYVACSKLLGPRPHTVVTPDPGELREALQPAAAEATPSGDRAAFWPAEPNIARIYAYWLNEKDHYAVDRAAADRVREKFPEITEVARANRAFLGRAVRYLARHGITQFIDVGSGLPASPNVHESARTVLPGARVVYVDRDPVVLAHARALLATDDKVGVAAGDIRDPGSLLSDPALTGLIDRGTPTGVLLVSVLHFLTDTDADAAVAALRQWMAPGSYLVISAGTSTGTDPDLIRTLQDAYGDTTPVTGRTASEMASWFEGFTLVQPGLVDVWAWQPDSPRRPVTSRVRILAGVGRKTHVTLAWPV